jgi:predicted AAA+ superfamily ATPase
MNKIFYQRKIYPELKEHLVSDDVTIITGMRRTGKTTLVEHLLSEISSSNKIFLDLEKISNQEIFEDKNYDNVILNLEQRGLTQKERMYVALDEIQTTPNIPSVIKYLNDHYNIKFILTGSSSYYLKNLFTESLAGRKKLFELHPLDFGEFLTFKNITYQTTNSIEPLKVFDIHEYDRLKAYYEEYIEFGGFPKVVLAQSAKDKKDILEDIISSYINIDIKSIADFKDAGAVFNIAKMLAGRIGNKLDYSKLSRLTGLSRPTIVNYIYLFESTYLISLVSVHTKNPDREIVKAQKVYFSDSGLAGILSNIDSGSKFENAVFNQLRQKGELRYFSLKTGNEIDFIIDRNLALEVKETPTVSDLKNLENLSGRAGVSSYRLLGRRQSPDFSDFIWGGSIR